MNEIDKVMPAKEENPSNKMVFRVELTPESGFKIVVAKGVNLMVFSYAVRLASLELDNMIIGMSSPKEESKIEVPSGIMSKIRG